MYLYALFIHSWLRWIVFVLLLVVLIKSFISFFKKKSYTKLDRALSSSLLGCVHLQFLLGLILYFALSPLVKSGLMDFKNSMKNPSLRYWTVEHAFLMFIFVVLIQIGFSLAKRASESIKKHRFMLIFSGIAFILLLAGMPWPIREYGRALFHLY